MLANEGGGLGVACLSYESLLCLLLGIVVRAPDEVVGGDGVALRLLHRFVWVAVQGLLLDLLRLLEELVFSLVIDDNPALMVLVERGLLLTLIGYLIRKLRGHLQLCAWPTVAALNVSPVLVAIAV